LRFAFYGRTSTSRFQGPASLREWQRDIAIRVVDGRGRIVVEFFDVGFSRSVPWRHRPQAAALLRAVADPGRGFVAVVIGEFERAFSAGQARSVSAELHACGITVWLAEFDGPVDLADSTHRAAYSYSYERGHLRPARGVYCRPHWMGYSQQVPTRRALERDPAGGGRR